MTICNTPNAEELLNLYVDGELSSADQARLFAHLSTCGPCRTQFNTLFAFRLAARQDVIEVPPAVDEAIFARIDQMRRVGTPASDRSPEVGHLEIAPPRKYAYMSVAAVALFVAAFGWSVRTSTLPEPEPVFQLTETVIEDGALYVITPGVTVVEESLAQ